MSMKQAEIYARPGLSFADLVTFTAGTLVCFYYVSIKVQLQKGDMYNLLHRCTAALEGGEAIFEGLKAYRTENGDA